MKNEQFDVTLTTCGRAMVFMAQAEDWQWFECADLIAGDRRGSKLREHLKSAVQKRIG